MLAERATTSAGGAPAHDAPRPAWQLVLRSDRGDEVARVALPDAAFAIRYRNSVYGSLAEERFAVDPAGRLALVELAADEAAVLDEYYETGRVVPSGATDGFPWLARPERPLELERLYVAATEHGRRTLVVAGRSLPLWQLTVADSPTIVLRAEQAP